MSTLHIVSRRLEADALGSLERSLSNGDAVLLSCDGVYLALLSDLIQKSVPCFALEADVKARGIATRWPSAVTQLNHAGFVQLCVQHDKSLSWS